ncbi:serine hydrolase domain-containing protein [Nocardia cyriacigeorgica]|uniref:serine hydrolase domain-containing protein n=1 Tax=Nocardia cyriacigeorgica TaxID=135487 RepID=UPI001896365F|nr:serine hydrolase domain-containing protein [Nocardia cyriacigeorgica]MBF6157811.1 beta-lactamase family protein [Nocardia cyriacigeorgica]MBF6196783.1 beta-lactamase family protein [Nocardia cyriacigeorgica]
MLEPVRPASGGATIRGGAAPGYHRAVSAFARFFAGGRGGGALAVYHRGTPVVDVWTGTSDADGTEWQKNTGAVSWSTSKGITATVLHRLAARGLIDYHAPVAEYWPEFAAKSKKSITVAEVLSHRAGLSRIGPLARSTTEMLDHLVMEDRLAAAAPDRFRGVPAYHAITYGWLAAGIARAVTGKGMAELYRTELAEPLGIDGLYLGTPPAGSDVTVATLSGSSLPLGIRNAEQILRTTTRLIGPGTGFIRSIYAAGIADLAAGPQAPILRTEMPAANGVFTARALAAVYNILATDNALLSRRRVRAASRIQTYLPDRNLLLPMGWRLGYHSLPIPGAPRGFGHVGLVGSGGWVDPDNELAVGFVHNWLPEATKLPRDQLILARLLTPVVRAATAPAAEDRSRQAKAG